MARSLVSFGAGHSLESKVQKGRHWSAFFTLKCPALSTGQALKYVLDKETRSSTSQLCNLGPVN